MFDLSTFTHKSEKIVVGTVQVNKTFIHHNASFECAAWYEDSEAQLGVYPIYLSRNYLYPNDLSLTAHIKAKVINDYFPALWVGMPVSNKPYEPKNLGQERTIYSCLDITEAVESTGWSPGNDRDIFIHPSWFKVFVEEAEKELRSDYDRFHTFFANWNTLTPETFATKNSSDSRWSIHDEYRSRVSMIGHFGKTFEKWARRAEKIAWQMEYHREGGKYNSEYNRNNFVKNTEWVKTINIQVNE